MQGRRMLRVRLVASAALAHLEEHGASTLREIAEAIDRPVHLARRAMVTLREDGLAYTEGFGWRHGRYTATFVAGQGVDAVSTLVQGRDFRASRGGLNFHSTQHLQPLYMAWGGARLPFHHDTPTSNLPQGTP